MTKTQILEATAALGLDFKKSWTKSRIEKEINTLLAQATNVVDHHEKHSKSFFWAPPSSASARRAEEARKSFEVTIGEYHYSSDVSCSCKNYYYTGVFRHKGVKANLRSWKTMTGKLGKIIELK